MIGKCCVGLVWIAMAVWTAHGQVESPASRLEAASALTSLDGIDQPAWHLKVEVTVFDASGQNPSPGTIDVWHAGTDERTTVVFGDASNTTLKHDGKRYVGTAAATLPFYPELLLRPILHPGPVAADLDGVDFDSRKQKFGKSEFDCVMLTLPMKSRAPVPLGLFPTYCMSGGVIRVVYNFGGQAIVLNHMGTFQGRQVATEAEVQEGKFKVASAKVVTLATYSPQSDEFLPTSTMKDIRTARISGSVAAGNRISFVPPVYPDSAKIDHLSGTVVLKAIIGRDGRVHSLRPVSADYPDFVISAIMVVRQWRYRPYLLNGEPVEVDTTITVNYELNPR